MDISQYILLAAVIAGVTEMLNRVRAKDYWTAVTVATAAVIGGVFGLAGVEGLNLVTGIAAGFGTSGSLSALGIVGKRSTPAPSTALNK
jgi:hypothetical protein